MYPHLLLFFLAELHIRGRDVPKIWPASANNLIQKCVRSKRGGLFQETHRDTKFSMLLRLYPTTNTLQSVANDPKDFCTHTVYLALRSHLKETEVGLTNVARLLVGEELSLPKKTLAEVAAIHVILTWGPIFTAMHVDQYFSPGAAQLVEGEKLWKLWNPVSKIGMNLSQIAETEPDHTILQQPGDIVVIPPGYYHTVQTLSSYAVMVGMHLPVPKFCAMYECMLRSIRSTQNSVPRAEFEIAAMQSVQGSWEEVQRDFPLWGVPYMDLLLRTQGTLRRYEVKILMAQACRASCKKYAFAAHLRDSIGRNKRKSNLSRRKKGS